MAKTSVFLPIAFEFDPNAELAVDAFGFSDKEKLELLMSIGRLVNGKDSDDLPLSQHTFMELRKDGKISDGLLIHLAVYGLKEMWNDYANGILLMLDAEKEE